ncbi:hypothetical protein KY348_00235 [Candidatus Woesearchaeota archaeon]|nr:hypothetical protein [Candidatus Woesearchaeota archaeon]
MELPIRIMIILFVAIVVGVMIIAFSRNILERSKEKLDNPPGLDLSDAEEQKIVELNNLDNSQLIEMVRACYEMHHAKTFNRELCFVVIASTSSWTQGGVQGYFQQPDNLISASIEFVGNPDYALKIYYEASPDIEQIEISR